MRLPRFRLRTLMIAVAYAGIGLWATIAIEDDTLMMPTMLLILPIGWLILRPRYKREAWLD